MSGFSLKAKSIIGNTPMGTNVLIYTGMSYVKALHISHVGGTGETAAATIKFFDEVDLDEFSKATVDTVFDITVSRVGASDLQLPKPGMLFEFGIAINVPNDVNVTVFYEEQ